jgi:hypothetical protein
MKQKSRKEFRVSGLEFFCGKEVGAGKRQQRIGIGIIYGEKEGEG